MMSSIGLTLPFAPGLKISIDVARSGDGHSFAGGVFALTPWRPKTVIPSSSV
ncbi:MAG: hypothetical protein WCC84_01685 [Candidatus Cybelea sp.]